MHETARYVIKRTMIGQMAIAMVLPGFNDLGHWVTPMHFSFDGSFSLLIFYVKRKNEENLSTSLSLIFLQNAPYLCDGFK